MRLKYVASGVRARAACSRARTRYQRRPSRRRRSYGARARERVRCCRRRGDFRQILFAVAAAKDARFLFVCACAWWKAKCRVSKREASLKLARFWPRDNIKS